MPALKPTLILFLAAFFLSQYSQVTHAGDWPQILGPNRTGIADPDEKLASQWPETGPPEVWRRLVGSGYAGIAVVDGVALGFHRIDNRAVSYTHLTLPTKRIV